MVLLQVLSAKPCKQEMQSFEGQVFDTDGDNDVIQELTLDRHLKLLPPLIGGHIMSCFISKKSLHHPVCKDKEHQSITHLGSSHWDKGSGENEINPVPEAICIRPSPEP